MLISLINHIQSKAELRYIVQGRPTPRSTLLLPIFQRNEIEQIRSPPYKRTYTHKTFQHLKQRVKLSEIPLFQI